MRVRASYKRIDRPAFKVGFDDSDYYTKTVEVDDDTDWNLLIEYAKDATHKGYQFINLVNIDKYQNILDYGNYRTCLSREKLQQQIEWRIFHHHSVMGRKEVLYRSTIPNLSSQALQMQS